MKHWILWLVAGLVLLLGGIMALANPFGRLLDRRAFGGLVTSGRFETPQPFAAHELVKCGLSGLWFMTCERPQ
jgi:uncharacterized membrane protein HdeD (DUF308 family)